jgi:hypothetical protein
MNPLGLGFEEPQPMNPRGSGFEKGPDTPSSENLCIRGCPISIQGQTALKFRLQPDSLQRINSIAIIAAAEITAPIEFLIDGMDPAPVF